VRVVRCVVTTFIMRYSYVVLTTRATSAREETKAFVYLRDGT